MGVLGFRREGRTTIVSRAYAASPLRVLMPNNHGHAAWVFLVSLGGGLVDGDQHNTYDINFCTPNPLTQFFYLAALRAIPEAGLEGYPFFAAAMGEMHRRAGRLAEAADQYRSAMAQARSPAEAEVFRQRLGSCE